MVDNEIVPDKAVPVEENLSNKISMASTANSSIFERTEVLTGNAPPCPGKSLILKIKMASVVPCFSGEQLPADRGISGFTSVAACSRVTSASRSLNNSRACCCLCWDKQFVFEPDS